MSRRQRITLSVLSIVSVVVGALVAYALWHSEATSAGAVIVAGSLDEVVDTFSWRDVSPDVPAGQRQGSADGATSAEATDSLAAYRAMPGDVLELRQDVVANLVGDNLQAKVTLTWDGRQSAVVPGMAITYHIEDSDHNQIAPASGESPVGGAAITITGATEGEDRYTVVITLTYDPATAPPTNSSVDPSSDGAGQAVIKRLYLTAQQVRGA